MADLIIHGASYSVYSRILRLALIEKGTPFEWVEIDIFDNPEDRAAQLVRHPFAKVPSLDHDGFAVFETGACLRYLEQPAFGPVRLIPVETRVRARADQIAGIVDAYAYHAMVWDTYVELVNKPASGESPNKDTVACGLEVSATILDTIESLADTKFKAALAGALPSFADIYLAPVLACFTRTGPGREMVEQHPRIAAWWDEWQNRPSMEATQPPPDES